MNTPKLKAARGKQKNKKSSDVTICINPATGEILDKIPVQTVKDVTEAVSRARRAQVEWAKLDVDQRINHIKKIVSHIQKNSDSMSEIISKDNGKVLVEAILDEVLPAAMATDYYCKKARDFLKDKKLKTSNILFTNKKSRITRVPYGVIGIISPWNYPFSIPYSEVIMALLAGNAVILKTASETQMVGRMLNNCINAAGLPKDLFTHINMPGRIAGDAFLDAGIDKLFFTGSVAIGKYLMKKASETLTPLVLELGGNDPMIVCEDADLYRTAVGAVWGGMQNAGQSCGGIERVYVHRKVYHAFLAILKNRVEALRVGEGIDFNNDIGAMTTKNQVLTVKKQVDEALKKGATLFAQSKAPKNSTGQFIPCMVLTDVNHDMLIMKDETFGPVLGVMPFDTIEEAVDLANDSYLGLTASVWSKNRSRARDIARRIKAGAVLINDHLMSHGLSETPWGGFKQSGIGRTHGEIGFNEMTQPQLIVDDLISRAPRNFWWHPYDRHLYDGVKGALDLLYAKSIRLRFSGFITLMRVAVRTFKML